ncbi:MAG: GntR family transcriptional regulator [Lachnospiraceae bacterium]|nr:GntR family transcriptional regulator [Lachnospiraceae bacterium]
MIIIDYKDTRPIYEQITEKFKTLILKGVLQPDEQMPSVRSLAMELSINPNTIQKAYAQLEWEGYIYPIKGRGNFVAGTEKLLEERKKSCIEKILMLSEEAAEYGISREEIISEIRRHKPKAAGNEEEGKIND